MHHKLCCRTLQAAKHDIPSAQFLEASCGRPGDLFVSKYQSNRTCVTLQDTNKPLQSLQAFVLAVEELKKSVDAMSPNSAIVDSLPGNRQGRYDNVELKITAEPSTLLNTLLPCSFFQCVQLYVHLEASILFWQPNDKPGFSV